MTDEVTEDVTEAFATPDELRRKWRTMPDFDDETLAEELLDASQYIVDVCPTAMSAAKATRRRVVIGVVKRGLKAEDSTLDGLESSQMGAGPYQETLKPLNPHGDYYLTRQERKALGCGRQKAASIDLLAGRDEG